MSASKALLHGDGLLRALTETAITVQQARTVTESTHAVARGLEALGLSVALISLDEPGYTVRYLTPSLMPLRQVILPTSGQRLGEGAWDLRDATLQSVPLLVEDLPGALRQFLSVYRPEAQAVVADVPAVCIIAPLRVRATHWGAMALLHDDLREEDLSVVRLFALQIGAAIDVADAFERLSRRNDELKLVHELAMSGPGSEPAALSRRALEVICRSTRSDCGVLHRYDDATQEYQQVGAAWGYSGKLVDAYRTFRMPADRAPHPIALPTRELPSDGDLARREGLQHMAIVPLRVEQKPVGLLTLGRFEDLPYDAADVQSAEILGGQVAAMIERARLSIETARLYGDLKRSYDELGHTQQELVRHERLSALGELAAVMAHEVRNPLGVIFNSLTTLKRLLRPSGDAEMLLNMVGEEADRLNRIVGDLLDFVRPYEVMKKPVAVEPLVVSAVDSVSQSTLSASVRVVTQFPRELPPFPLDAHLLRQALVNLVVNAAQAMPRGGTVEVEVFVEAQWLVMTVKDQGTGLSERATAKMFQPFFTTKATGTGLGLAVVKRIVDAHQGEVTARANEDGVGTTFVLRFPPTERSAVSTPPRPSPAVRPR